jgi:hypothetical protein
MFVSAVVFALQFAQNITYLFTRKKSTGGHEQVLDAAMRMALEKYGLQDEYV